MTLETSEDYAVEMEDHVTHGMDYETATRHISLNNLKAKFPTAAPSYFDEVERLKIETYTMLRVFAHMQKAENLFTLEPTDDNDLLINAISEAIEYKKWADGPEDAEAPEFMKWIEGMPSNTMIPSNSIDEEDAPIAVKRAPHVSSTDSPRKKAMAIYAEHVALGISKADTIHVYMTELKLQPATAQVYYSNAKTAANRSQG